MESGSHRTHWREAESSNNIPTPGHLHKTRLILQALFCLRSLRLQSPPKSKTLFPNLVSVSSEVLKSCKKKKTLKQKKTQQSVGMWKTLEDLVPVCWAELTAPHSVTLDVTSSPLAYEPWFHSRDHWKRNAAFHRFHLAHSKWSCLDISTVERSQYLLPCMKKTRLKCITK